MDSERIEEVLMPCPLAQCRGAWMVNRWKLTVRCTETDWESRIRNLVDPYRDMVDDELRLAIRDR